MTTSIAAVTFDCNNALDQARFWSQVLDRSVAPPEFSDAWYENASYLVPAGR